jgi:DNA mismatch repair protein MutS
MRQYREQKARVGDALLLFRMGDFYELFYDDAVLGAKLLGIALTSRDGGRTPLAGIPHHALESYLARLVAAGQKVAISEQIEEVSPRAPSGAGQARGLVRREIVRIVTPGTLTDEALLDRLTSNVLAAVVPHEPEAGLATLELASGELIVQTCEPARLLDELGRAAPAEVLLAEGGGVGRDPLEEEIRQRTGAAVTYRSAADFQPHRAQRLLTEQFQTRDLEGFGFARMDASLQAAGALVAYVRETQQGAARHLRPPRRRAPQEHVVLDPTTLRALEVERTLRTGQREGSLLEAVDRTANPMGARLLRQWLCFPLRDPVAIGRRQALVESLRADGRRRAIIREALRELGDLERMVGRLGVQRTHPRELRALGDGLRRLPAVREALRGLGLTEAEEFCAALDGLDALAERLCSTLRRDAPVAVREGGIFAEGVHPELDRLRGISRDGQSWLADFQARQIERTGIPSLKVGYNRIFGYYIEVTHPHRERVPPDYRRRQTVKNAERYVTDELQRYESEVLAAQSRANDLEHELFIELRENVARQIAQLQAAARALAELDVLAGWAELARSGCWCRPELVDEPLLYIEQGCHPVLCQRIGPAFVPNDTELLAGGRSLALITGPNMAGKSTYIRQVALLTLLAHCGCFVPAARMRLGMVDRIFTRVGASDELARGQSTFMIEMLETSNILHNATRDSLVILDEVGRGTSTFDGLALAWAITEHLATRCGCRTLFATHYHELTELAELLEPVQALNVAVREYEDQVVFLHRIVPGAADRSYGLHVARLAGIPPAVLERAHAVLIELERSFDRQARRPVLAAAQRRRQRQLRLFEEPEEAVVRELRELDPTELTPQRALEILAHWRRQLGLREPSAPSAPPEPPA